MASSPAPANLPINLETLLLRCRGKGHLVDSLLTKFSASVNDQIQELRDSLMQSDSDAVARLAHTPKGASANLSADPLSAAAAELELLSRARQWDLADASLARLESRVRECLDFVPQVKCSALQRTQGAHA